MSRLLVRRLSVERMVNQAISFAMTQLVTVVAIICVEILQKIASLFFLIERDIVDL